MNDTFVALKNRILAFGLKRRFPTAEVHSHRAPAEAPKPHVVLTALPSPVTRDSGSDYDQDIIMIHCVALAPEDALAMLQLAVDSLREADATSMPLADGTLNEVTMVVGRAVEEKPDAPDTWDATCTYQFTVERPRAFPR